MVLSPIFCHTNKKVTDSEGKQDKKKMIMLLIVEDGEEGKGETGDDDETKG